MGSRGDSPLARRVRWEPTGETTWPLRAEVDGQRWRIRLGDFPAEPGYTLVIGDEDVESFDDWPDACALEFPAAGDGSDVRDDAAWLACFRA